MRLIVKLILGIVAGIVMGLMAPTELIRAVATFQHIFGQFISFIMPLLIFFFVAEGIASLNYGAGKMLTWTVGLSYASTLGAGALAALVGLEIIPQMPLGAFFEPVDAMVILPYIKLDIPPVMGILTALVMAFLWGIGAGQMQSPVMRQGLNEGKRIIENTITHVMIPLLPFYIFSLFTEMTVGGQVVATLETFGLVLMVAVALHIIWLVVLYGIACTLTGVGLWKALKNMLPAYLTAIGTMSSVATIPVTLRQTLKNGVDDDIANFVVPLCATIHMAGSAITITTASIAVMLLTKGVVPAWTELWPFIMMLGVTTIAAPGAPGGAVMAALGLFTSILGFSEAAVGLMITIYIAQDSFGTACNVTGDGALAMIVHKVMARNAEPEEALEEGVS